MRYCRKCVYPENARPFIHIDDDGVCSGCRAFENRPQKDWANWVERNAALVDILETYAKKQRAKFNPYDCIIPVSGGKDSYYQVWYVRKLGFNPLLVSYNHSFNTSLGQRNLSNLIDKTRCNLVRYTTPRSTSMKLAKYMLAKIGDVTWHYHAGIMTFPIQASVQYDVPLIVWGEEGFSELVGMHNFDDGVEFTKKKRQEHSMRGIEPEDILHDGFTEYELAPFFYPSDETIERVGVRGIYLSNYINWDARRQTEFVIEEMGFESAQERDRTFNIHAKTDCLFANGLHDYLKYLKFGYGRSTDDASNEIRHGRMTRDEGIDMVMRYDNVEPVDMRWFMEQAGLTKAELLALIAPMRDPAVWKRVGPDWVKSDHVWNHRGEKEEKKWIPFKATPHYWMREVCL